MIQMQDKCVVDDPNAKTNWALSRRAFFLFFSPVSVWPVLDFLSLRQLVSLRWDILVGLKYIAVVLYIYTGLGRLTSVHNSVGS